MIRATELALKDSKGNMALVTCMTDTIAFGIQGYHDMNNMRRQAMKKEANNDCATLCNSTTVDASSKFLLGDLFKLAKDITDANKLTTKMRPSHQQGNYSHSNRYTAGGCRNFGNQVITSAIISVSKGHKPRSRMKKEGAAKQNWGFISTPPNQCSPPSHILTVLGFINSLQMTVSPTQEKIQKTIKACSDLLMMINPPIFEGAKVLGIVVSNFPGAKLGPLHYRALELDKTRALATNSGNYGAPLHLSDASTEELQWWVTHIPHAKRHISHGVPTSGVSCVSFIVGFLGCSDLAKDV